jgi:hypothetical protein
MTSAEVKPVVSVGIPTFNRVEMLQRALRSVLEQTYQSIEVVISDNASDDGTETFCRVLAARDQRVRYIRQQSNIGQFANFNRLFAELRSPYAMVLADDDWLEPAYVERCLRALRQTPGCAAVSGRGRYWNGHTPLARKGSDAQFVQPDGAQRVRAYFRLLGEGRFETSTFFGVMPIEVLRRATPMPIALAGDILVTTRIIFQGAVLTLEDVHLNRSVGGTSATMSSTVAALGLPARHARWPSLVIAADVLRELAWKNPQSAAPTRSRLRWALAAALSAVNWRSVAWHASAPTVAALARRPRGRWAWAAYDRLTRLLGAQGVQGGAIVGRPSRKRNSDRPPAASLP